MKKNYIILLICLFLLLFVFITIQPLPFIGEDHSILPTSGYTHIPISNFFPLIFSGEGITTTTPGSGIAGSRAFYYVIYTIYVAIGGGYFGD